MEHYRIYPLNEEGHISRPPKDIHAENDDSAIEEARKLLDGHDIEVWRGNKCIIALVRKK